MGMLRPPNLLEFHIKVLEPWSDADLQLLIDACAAHAADRVLADAESAVVAAFELAMTKECKRAGFRSRPECERWYDQKHPRSNASGRFPRKRKSI